MLRPKKIKVELNRSELTMVLVALRNFQNMYYISTQQKFNARAIRRDWNDFKQVKPLSNKQVNELCDYIVWLDNQRRWRNELGGSKTAGS